MASTATAAMSRAAGVAAGDDIAIGLGDSVVTTPFAPGDGLPLFIQPRDPKLRDDKDAAVEWFRGHRETFDAMLAQAGALVFRGFPIHDTAAFGTLISHYESPKFGYIAGSSPRRQIAPRVFESTYTPAQDVIMLHQEMAYLPFYPSRIAFFCRIPSVTAGETSLVDMRRVTAALGREFVSAVEERGILYTRNFRDKNASTGSSYLDTIHIAWQDAFATTDREKPLNDCKAMGLGAEWLPDGSLSSTYRSPGMITHPGTGERLWFNQISTTTICTESIGERFVVYDGYYGKTRPRPYDTTYGDGSAIPMDFVALLYEVLRKSLVRFPWSSGDVLLIDNFLTAHGRNSYTGLRDVQVALLD